MAFYIETGPNDCESQHSNLAVMKIAHHPLIVKLYSLKSTANIIEHVKNTRFC